MWSLATNRQEEEARRLQASRLPTCTVVLPLQTWPHAAAKLLDPLDIDGTWNMQQEEAEAAARKLAEVANITWFLPALCSASHDHAQEEAEAARRKAEVCTQLAAK